MFSKSIKAHTGIWKHWPSRELRIKTGYSKSDDEYKDKYWILMTHWIDEKNPVTFKLYFTPEQYKVWLDHCNSVIHWTETS